MKKTDWYKKDIEETLDYYYGELNDEQCLDHLMFWLENYPKLDFEWVDMMLDLGNYEQIPIDTVLKFADEVYKINPEYYFQRYEFIEGRIMDYAFYVNDLKLIKRRLEILKKNPVKGIDTVVSDTLYRLIYFGYYELALDFSLIVRNPLSESEELWGYPVYPFIMTIYLHKLEEQYEFFLKEDSSRWNDFLLEIKELNFDNEENRINCINNALTNDFKKETFEALIHKEDYQMLNLNIHFLKYMKKNYGVPFMLSDLWFNIINNKKLFIRKIGLNFFIPFTKLVKHITVRYDNFLGSKQIELFGKMWGLHYVYEFLNKTDLISGEDYEFMLENVAFLKYEFLKAMRNDLWKFNFVYTWTKAESSILNLPDKSVFSNTYEMNYNQADAHFYRIEFNLPCNERIEAEILTEKKSRGDYFEPPFYSGNIPFVKESNDNGRNDPCPCGSGKKYKKCCINKKRN